MLSFSFSFSLSLSALAILLSGGGVSGFAPLAPGQLVSSHLAASVGLTSPSKEPSVFFQSRIAEPKDVGSVPSAAFLLSSEFPEEPFVIHYRSASRDITGGPGKGPVLDLSVLKDITVGNDGNSIKVDAGVTVRELASGLSDLEDRSFSGLKKLFMTLPANGQLSVVEAALDERYEKLRHAVEELHVVDKDGSISSKDLADLDEQEDIVINIVLSPNVDKASKLETDKVVARWYTRLPTAPTIKKGFVSDLPDAAKVMVFKYGMYSDTPRIVVSVDGDLDIGLSTDEWDEVLVRTPEEFWKLQNELSECAQLDVLTASGVLDFAASEIDPSFTDILAVFQDRQEHLLVTIETGKIRASFDARYPPDVDDATRDLFTFEKKTPLMIAPSARDKPLMTMRSAPTTPNGASGTVSLMRMPPTRIMPTVTRGTVIEGFKGEIYDGTRRNMQEKRFQYATSSYDNMMNPSLIVYPHDEEDIALAIKYATLPKFAEARKTEARPSGLPFKVMGRGGGHQYCGVSCDNEALIVSMDHFKKLEHHDVLLEGVTGPDGKPHTATKEVHVGTGVLLKEWAEFVNTDPVTKQKAQGANDSYGVTIPHGECPTVGIGGHAQTGGYGHIVRSFGLAIDYVYGFTIVTTDGDIRTVNRDSPDQADKDLYWAVLGGSPGAFGITTNLVFHPILDKDYPHSTAWTATIAYSEHNMEAVLAILEDFINRARGSDDNSIAEGLDLMMSLSSNNDNLGKGIPFSISAILIELECRDMTDTKAYTQMQDIITNFRKSYKPAFLLGRADQIGKPYDGKSHYKLSELSLGFTRKPPSVTSTGRENRRPYRKAAYGSKDKVKQGWSKKFANLLNDVQKHKDIACIFQVVVGGGAQARLGKANINSISHRDVQLSSIVFDLFRGESDDTIKATDEFGKRFELEVVNGFQTAYPKVMAQWASHGDLDMNKKEVWEKYFDKPETYHELRRIKKDVDPDDIFHSRFTVRPADQSADQSIDQSFSGIWKNLDIFLRRFGK